MKIGIIGLGRRMSSILSILQKCEPGLEVCGLVDLNPDAARKSLSEQAGKNTTVYGSVAEMVAKSRPDALAIGTRCDSHARFAIEASAYGIPIFLEKPVATSMAQAQELEEAFQKSGCPVLVSFPLRASALCRRAKQILDGGAAGRIEHILAVNYVTYGSVYFESWYRDYSVTQGLFLQKATHDFDYLADLAGAPIIRVAATMSRGRVYRESGKNAPEDSADALYFEGIGTPESGMNEDSSNALLEFANGVKAVYTQVFYSKRLARRGAAVSGLEGTVEFDWYQGRITAIRHRQPFTEVTSVDESENHFGGDLELANNFVSMVRHGAPSLAPLSTGLASVYACLAARESAETGRFVDVLQTRLQPPQR